MSNRIISSSTIEELGNTPGVALVEVSAKGVRSNVSAVGSVTSGVRAEIDERYRTIIKEVFKELKTTP